MDMLIINLVLGLIMGGIAAVIASNKGRSTVGWFFGGFFLGLIGVIVVAVLPNLIEQREREEAIDRENRRLREQLRQERLKGESFRRHASTRLDNHDQHLGIDTRSLNMPSLPESPQPPAQLGAGPPPLPEPDLPAEEDVPRWFYEVNGESRGPVPRQEIRALIRIGALNAGSLLWTEDLGQWTPVAEVPEFQGRNAP